MMYSYVPHVNFLDVITLMMFGEGYYKIYQAPHYAIFFSPILLPLCYADVQSDSKLLSEFP
jgi:hypothetical protein